MKSNEEKFLGRKGVKFNKSQKPQKTSNFPDTQEALIEKNGFTKANSSLCRPNGGRVYYSSWKQAIQK